MATSVQSIFVERQRQAAQRATSQAAVEGEEMHQVKNNDRPPVVFAGVTPIRKHKDGYPTVSYIPAHRRGRQGGLCGLLVSVIATGGITTAP
jgi:hypothetical protein